MPVWVAESMEVALRGKGICRHCESDGIEVYYVPSMLRIDVRGLGVYWLCLPCIAEKLAGLFCVEMRDNGSAG